jgi:putative FmdB family regulatory protein
MPLYEYECQSCHRRLERIQKFSDPPLEVCPHCGGRLEKMVSSPAFQFKGSGWYVTDYARKNEKPPSESAGKETKDAKDASTTTEKSDKASSEKKDSSDSKAAAESSTPAKDTTKPTS